MIWPEIPAGVEPAAYYLCVGAAVVLIGLSKAGFGGGIGIVSVPLMGAVMPAPHMLGLMLPVLIAADALSSLHHLKIHDARFLRPLLVGALSGVAVGSAMLWLLQRTDPEAFQRALQLAVGALCLGFAAIQLYGMTGRRVPTLPPHPASSLGVGGGAGFVSALAHSAGPIVTIYLLQAKVEKRKLIGTMVLLFLIVNVSKVPTYAALGIINEKTLRDSVWFVPLIPVGTFLGAWTHRWIPERPFALLMYVAAAVTAGYMIRAAL